MVELLVLAQTGKEILPSSTNTTIDTDDLSDDSEYQLYCQYSEIDYDDGTS